MKLSRIALVAFIVFLVIEVGIFQRIGKATIEDSVVGARYQVVSVDGHPPERARHGVMMTVVPLVLVKSGPHEFELKNVNAPVDSKEESKMYLIQAEIKSGETYRVIEIDGQPQLSQNK